MFDIGFLELLIVAVIALLVLGPERLPVAARKTGQVVGKARRMVSEFSREIDRQIEAEELRAELKKHQQSLNIEEDVKNIQDTVRSALAQAEEYEPLPRANPDPAPNPTKQSAPQTNSQTIHANAASEQASSTAAPVPTAPTDSTEQKT